MKFLNFLLCGAVFIGLVGCGDNAPAESDTETPVLTSFGSGGLGDDVGTGIDSTSDSGVTQSVTPPPLQLSLKLDTEKKETVTVDVSDRNIHVIEGKNLTDATNDPLSAKRRDGIQVIYPTPSNTLAGKLTDQSKKIIWRPQIRPGGEFLGLPWLITATLSQDRSIFAVVERTGADKGPYGSRIVLINTFDFAVLKVIETSYSLRQIIVDDGRDMIYALAYEQKVMEQQQSILEINLKTETVSTLLTLKKQTVQDFVVSAKAGKFFLRYANEEPLYVYPVINPASGSVKTIQTHPDDFIGLSETDKTLTVFGSKKIVDYDFNDLAPYQTRHIPFDKKPKKIFNLGSRDRWAVVNYENKTLLYLGGQILVVNDGAGEFVFADPVSGTFYAEQQFQNIIGIFKIMPFGKIENIEPLKLFPKSSAPPLFADFLSTGSRILYLDRAGALWVFAKNRTARWSKIAILSAER